MKRNLSAGGLRNGGLSLSVLTDDEIRDIHLATLEVLERTGVWVEAGEALDIFADGGCAVDREARVVRIPPHVVQDAIDSAPAQWTLCGRDPKNDILLGGGRVGFSNFGEGLMVVDPGDGTLRASTKRDLADAARLVDALDDIDCFEVALGCGDAPPQTATIHNYEATVLNCTKPSCTGPQDGYAARAYVEMAAAAVGGHDELRRRPILMLGTCPVSPLKLPRESCEIVIEAARAGVPCEVLSMAMAGGSSPVTLAGTLVTHNVEVLAGITLNQLTERGSKVIYGSSTTAMDLRLAAASVGSPEAALISAAVAQLARQYRLPSYVSGAQGDSKLSDAQSGHEKTLTALLPALAGANLIYGAGMIESGVSIDYGQLVMDDEIARMVKHVVGGIRVDDETLAVDDIAAVGSFGDFLSLEATLRHVREASQPRLIDRRVREDWETKGASDLHARALARARELLDAHRPEPLPGDVVQRIRGIVAAADRELAAV